MQKITQFFRRHQNLVLALLYFGIIWPLYVYINQLELHQHFKKHILKIWLDEVIPFEPIWVFVYASMYAAVILPFVYVKDKLLYRRMFYSFSLIGLIAYVVFLVFPTFDILRPVTNPFDFDRFFLAIDNAHDSPYNCFPSLHVGFSMTAGLWTYYADRSRFGAGFLIWCVLVSISVLFVKEHYIADLLFGAVLSITLFLIFSRNLRHKIPSLRTQLLNNRLWVLIPVGLYLIEVGYVLIKYWDRFKTIFE
ncbi:MAG: phosphatase PAP2 family protein [Chitinophagaceae bacterium]